MRTSTNPVNTTRHALHAAALLSSLFCACSAETLTVGDLRCAGTTCEPSPQDPNQFSLPSATKTRENPERSAQIVWLSRPQCEDVACSPTTNQQNDPAQWQLSAAGTLLEARDFDTPVDAAHPHGQRFVLLRELSADGSELWSKRITLPRQDNFALAENADGCRLLVVGEATDTDGRLTLNEIGDDGELTVRFRDPAAGVPVALACSGSDVVVAAYYGANPELSRYDRKGVLRFRQAVLGETRTRRADAALALDTTADGEARLLLPVASPDSIAFDHAGDEWIVVGNDGLVEQRVALQKCPECDLTDPHASDAHTGLVHDTSERPILAWGAYSLLRCPVEGCAQGRLGQTVSRTQDAFYQPAVLGLAVDAQDRIYVMTQDGVRAERRLLLDRFSADLSERDTFVVEGDDANGTSPDDLFPVEIRVDAGGNVYFWAVEGIGKIALE